MHHKPAIAAFLLLPSLAGFFPSAAEAHFKQLAPASWLNEDELGGPQKGSPCGPGNARPFIGDDIQPVPESGAVTTFRAGETVKVKLQETIYHPGYFRVAFAPVTAADATTTHFPDPALTDTENCYFDVAAVQTKPHGDVLADGMFMVHGQEGEGRSLDIDVKLPSEPCEHCTLQVVQVMEGHPASSCFYYHCADIRIVAGDSAAAGSSGTRAGAAAAGTAGTSTPTPASSAASSDDGGGCSVARANERPAALYLLGAALLYLRRRRVIRRAA